MSIELTLITLFIIKHFVADFPLQPAFMWKNKGTFGHPGGIAHAIVHAMFTFGIFSWVSTDAGLSGLAIKLALLDFSIHYVVDWSKMNLNRYLNLAPHTSPHFWNLLGLDQLAHYMTYVLLIYLWVN